MDARVLKLACPHCGAALEIHPDQPEQFACGYCGAAVLIQRRGGTVALREIAAGIDRVRENTDRTAAELALRRYQAELDALVPQRTSLTNSLNSSTGQLFGCAPALLLAGLLFLGSAAGVAFVLIVVALAMAAVAFTKRSRSTEELAALAPRVQDLEARIAEKKRVADG